MKKSFPKLSRKDLLAAIERGIELLTGESLVHRPAHGKYELRVRRLAHGVELKWGRSGHFFNPQGKDE